MWRSGFESQWRSKVRCSVTGNTSNTLCHPLFTVLLFSCPCSGRAVANGFSDCSGAFKRTEGVPLPKTQAQFLFGLLSSSLICRVAAEPYLLLPDGSAFFIRQPYRTLKTCVPIVEVYRNSPGTLRSRAGSIPARLTYIQPMVKRQTQRTDHGPFTSRLLARRLAILRAVNF